ncbi:uncharacterized protein LOC131602338 [Vicia villosa]|uniref:uncharacterized protein LOC131602338 n=1 Tax=Vicia villosa TaxID=3911 RepID=UPI00273BE829|nr:uncharacterized protein LOC131602338 [Vicia villosa]
MTWYKNLPRNSVRSWAEFKDKFSHHFTGSRRHPKTEASLEAIVQGPTEPLRAFLDRFNRKAVQVPTTEEMKLYLLDKELRPGSDFHKAVGIEKPRTLEELLIKAQAYITYEERANPPRIEKSSRRDDTPPRRGGEKRREERSRDGKENRGPFGRFTEYTPLTAPRESIWTECKSIEFKDGGVCVPKPGAPRPGADKSKWCKYHKSYGHLTEDCVHLKDAIETLIKEGRLSKYTKRGYAPRKDNALSG